VNKQNKEKNKGQQNLNNLNNIDNSGRGPQQLAAEDQNGNNIVLNMNNLAVQTQFSNMQGSLGGKDS
jgi:hypothetical protein